MRSYIITTEKLGLRKWIDSDIKPFAAMNNDPAVMEFFPGTLTEEETMAMIKRIELHFEQHGFGLYAVEEKASGDFIGFTGLMRPSFESFFTPCVEIGWRYKKEAWGKGFATEAARACLQYGFEQLGLDSIYSFTAVLNKRSEEVMKRIGMQRLQTFDHPKIESSHRLCRHILYRIDAPRR